MLQSTSDGLGATADFIICGLIGIGVVFGVLIMGGLFFSAACATSPPPKPVRSAIPHVETSPSSDRYELCDFGERVKGKPLAITTAVCRKD